MGKSNALLAALQHSRFHTSYPYGQHSDMNSNEEWRLNLINLKKDRNAQVSDKNKCLKFMDVYDQTKILKRENK